jgi:hypothetical protein
LDLVALNPATGYAGRTGLIETASELAAIDNVVAAGVIEGEPGAGFDLAFYFVLTEFAALEPFGTDPRYSRFLQGEVAPRLQAFAGADVRLEQDFAATEGPGAVLALAGPDDVYDWEVREALQAWAAATGAAGRVIGLAVGERQLYRGLALCFGEAVAGWAAPEPGRFRATLVSGRARALA